MCFFEAIESTVCPLASVRLLWILVSAFHNFWSDNSLVLALAQLFHQMINIEAIFLVKKSHFFKDAFDIALCSFVTGEVEFFVFIHFVFWYAERCCTFWAISVYIINRLNFPFGVGGNLWKNINDLSDKFDAILFRL